MRLFNNPKVNLSPTNGSTDGTFLHNDVVFERIVSSLTPPTIYKDNKELINSFVRTVANYSPISINIMDFWNKEELYNVVIPLDLDILDYLPKDKINEGPPKSFFINSIIGVQEQLARTYMTGFYTQAFKARNSHILRLQLKHLFEKFGMQMDDKSLIFGNVNKLFTKERNLTYKEFNEKKGKVITFEYAARAAYEAKIEGVLTSSDFFLNYQTDDIFNYTIESTIVPEVYNAFVKPLCHPLGMGGIYKKICKQGFEDKVLADINWRADAVSIRCSNPSDTSPLLPPPMLQQFIENPNFDINLPVDASNLQYIYDETSPRWYECVIPNTELITKNNDIQGPNHPNNPLPNIVFANINGDNLWSEIADFDNNEGNILIDVQNGYGDLEYSGLRYAKYVFENNAYVIEYNCLQDDGKFKRVIEYYRYDLFNFSVDLDLTSKGTVTPTWLYPQFENTNMVHGSLTDFDSDTWPDGPLGTTTFYSLDDDDTNIPSTLGLDTGVYGPVPSTYNSEFVSRINVTGTSWQGFDQFSMIADANRMYITYDEASNGVITLDWASFFPSLTEDDLSVFVDGVLTPMTGSRGFSYSAGVVTYSGTTPADITVIKNINHQLNSWDSIDDNKYVYINNASRFGVFVDGIKLHKLKYEIIHYPSQIDPITGDINDPYTTLEILEDTTGKRVEIFEFGAAVTITHTMINPAPTADSHLFEYAINSPAKDVLVFDPSGRIVTNSLNTDKYQFTFIHEYNQWSSPKTYNWDVDSNVINTKIRVAPVETLIGRWVETRGCIVNTFNLRKEVLPSIDESFDIKIVPYQRNIIETEDNIVHKLGGEDINVLNSRQIHI